VLDPGNAIVGSNELIFFLEINPSQRDRGCREQGEEACGKAYLEIPVH